MANVGIVFGIIFGLIGTGLSIWNWVQQHLPNREARVTAWFAKTAESQGSANRLVIANNGPAEARDLTIEFKTMDGRPWNFVTTTGHPFPIPLLVPGDQFYAVAFVPMTGNY